LDNFLTAKNLSGAADATLNTGLHFYRQVGRHDLTDSQASGNCSFKKSVWKGYIRT